jgi:hypothetical protein
MSGATTAVRAAPESFRARSVLCAWVLSLVLGAACGSNGQIAGGVGAHCYPNRTCNDGLSCLSNLCVVANAGGSTGDADATAAGGSSGGSAGAGAGGAGGTGTMGTAGAFAPDGGSGTPACTLGSAIIGRCAL